jgi:uncharacterized SAM-binding protein YcdF (DUF218 family)/lysophospholipase L1-like esterase
MCAGVLLVLVLAVVIDESPIADWVVNPLLVPDGTGAEPADAVVVLGAGVIGDCSPNNNALRRVILGVRQWRAQQGAVLLFTGGTGDPCPVAEAMARSAREFGVPKHRLRVETTATNTHENAELTAALLRGWGMSRVVLVTDHMHMRRAVGTFERSGFTVRPASVPIYEGHEDDAQMLWAGLREYAALAYYRARGWIGRGEAGDTAVARAMPIQHHTNTMNTTTGPIAILGASYAASWPLADVAGVPVINKGVAGQQSFELLERFDADVAAAAPRAVILWGFINDIFRAPAGGMDTTLAAIRGNYEQLIQRARAHGIEPILATEVTIRPRSETVIERLTVVAASLLGRDAYQDHINQHVLAVNQWLIDTAARERLLILHLQPVLAEPRGRRRAAFAQPDGSHITAAGYGMLTSYALPLLKEFIVDR